jgi:hypothetical protein
LSTVNKRVIVQASLISSVHLAFREDKRLSSKSLPETVIRDRCLLLQHRRVVTARVHLHVVFEADAARGC